MKFWKKNLKWSFENDSLKRVFENEFLKINVFWNEIRKIKFLEIKFLKYKFRKGMFGN